MKRELKIFDNPANVRRLLVFFFAFLAVLFVIDFFIPRPGEFSWERAPGFFAVYGFCSYVLLIFTAKGLRKIVKRDESYYD